MRHYALVMLLALAAAPAAGQGPAPLGMRTPITSTRHDRTVPGVHASIRKSYWMVGAIAGAATGLLVGNAFNSIPCDSSPCGESVMTYVVWVTVFGTIGGLIGSLFHKR